jgi:hypothetical protein
MGIFLGTLVVFLAACLLLGAGLILDRRKLSGGCGHKPEGAPRCEDCPNANRHGRQGEHAA